MPKSLPDGTVIRSVEFRLRDPSAEYGDGRTLDGYAAVFNEPTEINSYEGHFHETLARGAFKKTLKERKPIMQFDHGHDVRVGSVPIAAIQSAQEDSHGLHVVARMFDNPVVEPIRQAIAGQAISGMSFRFQPVRDSWTDSQGREVNDPDELEQLLYGGRSQDKARLPLNRLVREVKCSEMGPVVNPAYGGTSVGVRSAADLTETDRAALMEEYRRTMMPASELLDEEREEAPPAAPEEPRSGPQDGDDDEDDTLPFDHFASDVPVREDGLPEGYEEKFSEGDDEAEGRAASSGDPKKPYGDVPYADKGYQADGVYRYPLDTKAHVDTGWKYINVAKNAAKYSSGDLAKVKNAIKAAAKKFGITISDDSEKKSAETSGAARSTGTPARKTPDAAPAGTSAGTPGNETRKVAEMPKTKEELVERSKEILEQLAVFDSEETRDAVLDEQSQEDFDALTEERDSVDAAIRKIEERQERLAKMALNPDAVERDTRSPAFHPEVDPFDMDAIRASAGGNREREVRALNDNAKRAIDKIEFAEEPDGYDGPSAGDVALRNLTKVRGKEGAVAERYLLTGSADYERAFAKLVKYQHNALFHMSDAERRAIEKCVERAETLGTDSQGGYAVPFQLDPTVILNNAGVVNPIRQLAKIVQITGKTYEWVVSAGATATRGAEGSTAPDSSFTLSQPTLQTNRVQAFVPFTYEIDLAWSALRSEITEVLVDAKEHEENSFITGDGTGTNPFGLLGYTTGLVNVTTVGTAAFTASDVYKVETALNPRYEANASWLAHKGIYNLLRQVDTAGGAELWARIGDGRPNSLMDYPAYRSSAMASAPTTGSQIAVVGDFSKFVIVDRLGMNVELVPQIFDASNGNRPTGQRGVYAVWMNSSKRIVDDAFRVLVAS